MRHKLHTSINWISGVVFLIIALAHAVRVAKGASLMFGDFSVPQIVSIVGAIFFAALAYFNFQEARCCKNRDHRGEQETLKS